MNWYEAIPERWEQERTIAAQLLEDFKAEIDHKRTALVRGKFDVVSEHGHVYESVRLRFEYPQTFPSRNQAPSVYLESHRGRWLNVADSHIESDWRLCLFVPIESRIDFSVPTSLNNLFAVVHTFLLKERIYQQRLARWQMGGSVPKWPGEDRPHGIEGIRKAIRECGGISGDDPCPCGSGRKFKRCHRREL